MKGSMTDMPIQMALFLSGVMTIFIVYLVLTSIANAWTFGGESKAILDTGVSAFGVFDYMFLFFAFGLGAFSIVSAFYINTNPVFFIFSIILMAIMVTISANVTNIFDAFATSSVFEPIAANFPYITTFMRNLPLFFLVIGIIIAVVMHAKPNIGGGQI